MTAHLYFVLSTYTPLTIKPDEAKAVPNLERLSATLLIKLFTRALTPDEDLVSIPSNTGSSGLGTLVIGKTFTYLKNPLLTNTEVTYPQLEKIIALTEALTAQIDLNDPQLRAIPHLAHKLSQIENVTLHNTF
jgi:hypothetical protein